MIESERVMRNEPDQVRCHMFMALVIILRIDKRLRKVAGLVPLRKAQRLSKNDGHFTISEGSCREKFIIHDIIRIIIIYICKSVLFFSLGRFAFAGGYWKHCGSYDTR